MSFNVSSKAGPNIHAPVNTSAQDARTRAISMLSKPAAPQAQELPVANPTQVAPEEVSALGQAGMIEEKVQPDTTETPASDKPEETPAKPEDPLSSQYAILARKEKALRAKVQQQDQAVKARETALQAREDALKAKEAEYSTGYIAKNRLTEDTLGVLAEAGIPYDQLVERALNAPQMDPATKAVIQRLEKQMEEQRKIIEDTGKKAEQQQKDQYNQAITQIRNDVTSLVKGSDDFELVRETNSIKDVVELIQTTFHKGLGEEYPAGTMLDLDTAAKMVEDHLFEEMGRLAKLKKIQSKFAPKAAEAPAAPKADMKQAATQGNPAAPAKTLTNQMTTQRKLSAKERAILAFKGEQRS